MCNMHFLPMNQSPFSIGALALIKFDNKSFLNQIIKRQKKKKNLLMSQAFFAKWRSTISKKAAKFFQPRKAV